MALSELPSPPPLPGEPFAILRHVKHSGFGSISAASEHMLRTRPTPNADPSVENIILVGGPTPYDAVKQMVPPEKGTRDQNGRLLRRKNSVLAIEILATTSPDWWNTATDNQKRDWILASQGWIEEYYGKDNVAHLQLHIDEKTPHLTGFIVPLDDGALNARKWVGGRYKCAAMQTSYADSVKHLGLRRGIEGSVAKHERVKRHHGALASAQEPVAVPAPSRITLDPAGWAKAATVEVAAGYAPSIERAAEIDIERANRKRAEAQAEADRERAKRAEQGLNEARKIADRMRALPLPDVLKALGFEQDKQDRKKWRHDASIIGVGEGAKASKWFDYTADVGKGGAIDLVSHCMGTDFKGGLAWLADRFGPGAAAADLTAQIEAAARDQVKLAAQERPAFAPPAPDPEKWPEVRAYLVKERVISTALIDGMHERGKVYADARANAVFPQLAPDGKTVTGAEVKGTRPRADGTRFAGLALGSHRAAGLFRLLTHAAAQTVYLAEAAIDAVSLFSRLRRAGETNFAVVSAAGVAQRTPSLVAKLWPGARKVCAFDADLAGDKAAAALKVEGWERLRPVGAKDWNAVALIEASASRGEPPQPQQRRVELDRDSGPSFQ